MAAPNSVPSLYTDSISAVTTSPAYVLGQLRRDGEDVYRYVYNAGNSQINPKYICIVSALTGYSVTVSSVAEASNFPVGVCRHATITTGMYGWVQKEGFAQLYNSGGTAIVAAYPICAGTDGTSMAPTGGTGFTGYANMFGYALTATTTAGTFDAYIVCR